MRIRTLVDTASVHSAVCLAIVCAGALFNERAGAQCEVQKFNEPNGWSIRTDGEVAALGRWYGIGGEHEVLVHQHAGLELLQLDVLTSPDPDVQQHFGERTFVFGEWIAIADYALNRVYLFRGIGGKWQHVQTLQNPYPVGSFGRAIAMDDERMIIGAPTWNTNTGTAFIYRLENDVWVFEQEVPNPDPYVWQPFSIPDRYGSSVAIHGSRAVIGAPSSKMNAGRVYVYEHEGGEWVHTQTFAPNPPDAITLLGADVGTTDDVIMASGYKGEGHGRVYFFWPDGTSTYIMGTDYPIVLPSPNFQSPQFGLAAALHSDGRHVLVSYDVDSEVALGAGAAFLLRREGKEWVLQKKLIGSNISGFNSWGGVLAMAGDFALVGAINAVNPGKVHLFAGVKGEDCNESGQPDACDVFFGDSDDTNNNLIPDECETPGIPGDLTGDGSVGVPDLLLLLAAWGECASCEDCPADLTGNCSVGVGDLLMLLANWG